MRGRLSTLFVSTEAETTAEEYRFLERSFCPIVTCPYCSLCRVVCSADQEH